MSADITVIQRRPGLSLQVDAVGLRLYESAKWCLLRQRTKCGRTYAYLERIGDRKLFHRLLMDAPRDKCVDHIDGDGMNNALTNLRLCTHAENMRNRRPTLGRVLPKGVGASKFSFYAEIRAGAIRRRKRGFATPEAAASQYAEWAAELHGEFARTGATVLSVEAV